jgi:hypothetical protein
MYEKYAVVSWDLGIVSAFACRRKNRENLCQDGRSQDLLDTY